MRRRNESNDLPSAFKAVERGRAEAVFSLISAPLFDNRARIAEFAVKHRLPVFGPFRDFAEAGALLTYGVVLTEVYRYAATHVDKILKGARPADLPIEQPTKFDLVINMRAAKMLELPNITLLLRRLVKEEFG